MPITVQYFGILAEATGRSVEEIEAYGPKAGVLRSILKKHPELSGMHFITALNGVVTHAEISVGEGDTIALIPPAPGG